MEIRLRAKTPDITQDFKSIILPLMKQHVRRAKGKAKTTFMSGPHPKRLISRSGKLSGSIRSEVRTLGNSVYGKLKSDNIYAPVHEFGGTIHPKGAPVKIPKRPFMYPALISGIELFEKMVTDAIAKDFNK